MCRENVRPLQRSRNHLCCPRSLALHQEPQSLQETPLFIAPFHQNCIQHYTASHENKTSKHGSPRSHVVVTRTCVLRTSLRFSFQAKQRQANPLPAGARGLWWVWAFGPWSMTSQPVRCFYLLNFHTLSHLH